MDIVSVIAIGGIAMVIVGLIGGIDSDKVKIPVLPTWIRVMVVAVGLVFLILSVYIFPQSPFNPTNAMNFQGTRMALEITQTALDGDSTAPLISPTAPTEAEPGDVLLVDSIPASVDVFMFDNNPDPDRVTWMQIVLGTPQGMAFRHIFNFPLETELGAGMTFNLDEPVDVSDYDALQFTIELSTDMRKCEIYLLDAIGNYQSTFCKEPFNLENNVTVISEGNRRTVTVPLESNYPEINLNVVKKLYFVVNPFDTQTSIIYQVSGLRFIRQE